jgi:glycosidase
MPVTLINNSQSTSQISLNQTTVPAQKQQPVAQPSVTNGNLLEQYLKGQAAANAPMVTATKKVETPNQVSNLQYKNDLRQMFQNNQAKILAIIPRIFNADDKNHDDQIELNMGETSGNFNNAIARLDEVKANGFNTLHVLPIFKPGKVNAKGTAGSVYATADYLQIDPMLDDKKDPRSVNEEFKGFVNECHKRGIKVMLDLPSCAAVDLFDQHPELMAKLKDGTAKVPQGWDDIRMFNPWDDETKRTLNQALFDMHKKVVDNCIDAGVDGIRADVARAKPPEFWDKLIKYSHSKDPNFAWLAETYTYEDASPMVNMPADRPEDLLKAGFDSYYGQFHIFHEWGKASDLTKYVEDNLKMSQKYDKGKSLIGSFATHDDMSPMFNGGVDYCNLTTGLQATLPMVNPYIVDGFQSGDNYLYKFEGKKAAQSYTETNDMHLNHGNIDIFNLSRKPGGDHPEIGKFLQSTFAMRDKYKDVITKGSFIELDKTGDKDDQIIAYARHLNGKTLLVVANKNIDRNVSCSVKVPTLQANQEMTNLLPSYGKDSKIQAANGEVNVDLGPARVHVFEINTPDIEKNSSKVFKQNV